MATGIDFMKTENTALYAKCSCSGHMLQIERYDYSETDKYYMDEGFYISTWINSFNYKLCWNERLRWIWNIIITGIPWSDNIIINNDQAMEISKYINKHLSKE